MHEFATAEALVAKLSPQTPVRCLRPQAARRAARWFLAHFPGDVLYALKANDAPHVVEALGAAGITHFDVASLGELRRLQGERADRLYLMTPVKSREAIAQAYHSFGVRHFALDCLEELAKIRAATGQARDLTLYVRLAVPNEESAVPLAGKFGISPDQAPDLLRAARAVAQELGICFHVGSQAMQPESFARAVALADAVAVAAGVSVERLDVGGGFPCRYGARAPVALDVYVRAIVEAVAGSHLRGVRLMAEPGRALAAEAESLIVRVIGRKGKHLYIDDGVFGHLLEGAAMYSGLAYPVRRLDRGSADRTPERRVPLQAFALYGPTCDSVDYLPGPFMLPADVAEGDYLEIGNTGAYGRVCASGFNGFGDYGEARLLDAPMASMFAPTPTPSPAQALA